MKTSCCVVVLRLGCAVWFCWLGCGCGKPKPESPPDSGLSPTAPLETESKLSGVVETDGERSERAGRSCGSALLPLYPGGRWAYRTADDGDPGSAKTWEMVVTRPPMDGADGTMRCGAEPASTTFPLVNNDGNLRIDGLGYLAPLEFEEMKNVVFDGETLPRQTRFIEGGVWEFRIRRDVAYRIADKDGILEKQRGVAEERHRALAGPLETVRVPAGTFEARRIGWTSRVKLRTGNRPVLTSLTAAPYRTETMWVVPCVGIVKRRITFVQENRTVLFELNAGPVAVP